MKWKGETNSDEFFEEINYLFNAVFFSIYTIITRINKINFSFLNWKIIVQTTYIVFFYRDLRFYRIRWIGCVFKMMVYDSHGLSFSDENLNSIQPKVQGFPGRNEKRHVCAWSLLRMIARLCFSPRVKILPSAPILFFFFSSKHFDMPPAPGRIKTTIKTVTARPGPGTNKKDSYTEFLIFYKWCGFK